MLHLQTGAKRSGAREAPARTNARYIEGTRRRSVPVARALQLLDPLAESLEALLERLGLGL